MEVQDIVDRLRPLVAGRRVVLVGGMLAGEAGRVARLRQLGAERVLILAAGTGTGELPSPEDADWVVSEVQAPDIVTGLRATEALFEAPPPAMLEALARFDPAGEALVLGGGPEGGGGLRGRPAFGQRPPEWIRLEDKTLIDRLWDELGIERAPAAIVAAERTALESAAARFDVGEGTAWAGDAREGFNGGAVYFRWVRTPEQAGEAARFFSEHCDRVRVMPFLEGIPVSIHGVVFPDATAALRPVEMVCLRRPGQSRLVYAGCATYYDPPADVREAMRHVARIVGEGLRDQVGYRGAFTVDGVVTADGFRPTELNPRMGGGLSTIARGVPDLPLDLMQFALIAGEDLGIKATQFEDLILPLADARRAGGAWTVTEVAPPHQVTTSVAVVLDEAGCREATSSDNPTATIGFGPGQVGGFVRCEFDPASTPKGPSVGPRAVQAFAFADRRFGSGLGELSAARPMSPYAVTA